MQVWGAEYSFDGDLCQFPEASRFDGLCKGADGKWVLPPPQGTCCQTRFNGGLWMISPSARGSLFVRAWLAVSSWWGEVMNISPTTHALIFVKAVLPLTLT